MELQIFKKGRLCSADCSRCGRTLYAHEWASGDFNEDRDAMQTGTLPCPDCSGHADAGTFWESPRRNWYAGWYSAPGYMDCTDYSYGTNRRRLERELREMYG
jgi:hypothetical protein